MFQIHFLFKCFKKVYFFSEICSLERLRSSAVTEVIHSVLVELLSDYTYDSDTADKMVNKLGEVIRERLHGVCIKSINILLNIKSIFYKNYIDYNKSSFA